MDIERNLIISILKLTRDGPVSTEIAKKDAKITSEIAKNLIQKLQKDKLIYLRKNFIEADDMQRLRLAVRAIQLGADIENISNYLQWQEFESIVSMALEQNGYSTKKNLRFKHAGKRWEIDLIGCKKPIVLCVDCKHWHRGLYPSILKKIVDQQIERTVALVESLPSPSIRVECATWDSAKFVPAVLSLVVGKLKFYENVPIVPVLQLQDFLNNLPANIHSLKHFTKIFNQSSALF